MKDEERMIELRATTLVDGLWFPEGPRWHEGRLWFSDVLAHWVMAMDSSGMIERIVEVPNIPSGLGWLPDGQLLVVSTTDRRLLRLGAGGLVEHANLWSLASERCNDMVVDLFGRAYVGNWGCDLEASEPRFKAAEIVLVSPDGAARVAATDLVFPNGTVIAPDGRTLIVAESFAARLTAFDVASDGTLGGRRVWAQFDDLGFALKPGRVVPDGICLDADGAIWMASPETAEVLRVKEGGEVTHRVTGSNPPYACALGGSDRRTLFILTAASTRASDAWAQGQGRIEAVRVVVPGAGLP